MEFSKHFKGMQGVTTHQSDNEEAHYFSGTVYVNRYEFVCIDQMEESGCNRREKRIPKTD